MGIIYKHENLINNKIYIGQTKYTLESRIGKDPIKSYKNSSKFIKDIKLYGWDNFSSVILEEVDNFILDDRELFWINYFNSIKNGYNRIQPHQLKNIKEEKLVKKYNFNKPDFESLYNSGYSLPELAYIYDTNYFTLKNMIKKLNLDTRDCGYLGIKETIRKRCFLEYKTNKKCLICSQFLNPNSKTNSFICSKKCLGKYFTLNNHKDLKKSYIEKDLKSRKHYENLANNEIEIHNKNIENFRKVAIENTKISNVSNFIERFTFDELKMIFEKSNSIDEISQYFNVSKNLICKVLKFYDLKFSKKSERITYEDLLQDLNTDTSLVKLSEKYNISCNGYRKYLKKYNLPYHKKDRILYKQNNSF